jgi:FkbM family methyltransferase
MIRRLITSTTTAAKGCLPNNTREVLWRLRGMPRQKAYQMIKAVRPADLLTALRMHYADPTVPAGRVRIGAWRLPGPIVLRSRTSDIRVFDQVFLDRQYDRMPVRDPRVIVDAGANIGLASLFLLRKYPDVRVIAIEPDPENLPLAEKNLHPYRDRCILLPGALWSMRARLSIKRSWAHWATQVVAEPTGGTEVQGYSLADLKTMFGLTAIDLLKIDIEGAELEVFGKGGPAVLEGVRCCAVELHGDVCREAFFAAAAAHQFKYDERGELTIAWRSPG